MVEGGGPLCRRPVITTADGRYLLVAVSDRVRLYGVASGTLSATLSGHTASVTAVVLNSRNDAQVYTASRDGTIILWDYADGEIAKRYEVGVPITHMVVPARGKYAVLMLDTGGKTRRIRHFNLAAGTLTDISTRVDGFPPLTVSQSGRHAATFVRHTTFAWCPQQPKQPYLHIHATKTITCAAIDAADARLATGDATGRIRLYPTFAGAVSKTAAAAAAAAGAAGAQQSAQAATDTSEASSRDLPCTTWHWHAHAVGALCFSPDGTYLLSGGQEAVLVIWQLADGERSFLPRLGAAIVAITACKHDPAKSVVCQADNTIRVVNMATRAVECSIFGLQPLPRGVSEHAPSAALLLPRGGELVTAVPNASLQLYSLAQDRHIERLQVAPRNAISLTEDDFTASRGPYAAPVEPHVTHAACSSDGSVLVTVHVVPDASPHGGASSVLQFWDRAGSGGETSSASPHFELNSVISQPHRERVTAVAYHPSQHVVATTGLEGDVRLWSRTRRKAAPGAAAGSSSSSSHWHCRSVASYQGEPMHAAAFSPDGSLLATAAGCSLTLWNPHSNSLLKTLSTPGSSHLHSLAFVQKSTTLVGATAPPTPALFAWDLVTGAVQWSSAVHVTSLVSDPEHASFAAAIALPQSSSSSTAAGESKNSKAAKVAVAVFEAQSAAPKHVWRLQDSPASILLYTQAGSELRVQGERSSPKGTTPLAIITADRRYCIAAEQGVTIVQGADGAVAGLTDEAALTGYQAAFGGSLNAQAAREAAKLHKAVGVQSLPALQDGSKPAWTDLFDAPSHVLPPLTSLLPMFLDVMVRQELPVQGSA